MKFAKLALASALCVLAAGVAFAGPVPEGTKMDKDIYINDVLKSEPSTLDTSRRSDAASSHIQYDTSEGLVRLIEVDGKYEMAPAEAESWEVSEDGKTWTFHLRDGIKWEDGVPVTAEQYVFGIRRTADPKVGSPNSWFFEPLLNYTEISEGKKPVEELGVSAPDSKTLVFTLTDPSPVFLSMINTSVYYPQREDKLKEWGDKFGSEAKYYISNGPFKLVSWSHNSKIEAVKNENYWDAKNVYANKITYFIIKEDSALHNAFMSGQTDIDTAADAEWCDKLEKTGCQAIKVPGSSIKLGIVNCKDKVFKNVKIRKAFSLALDRDEIGEVCFGGALHAAEGYVMDTQQINGENFRKQCGNLISDLKKELADQGKTPKDLLIEGMKEAGLGDDPSKLDITLTLGSTDEWSRTLGDYLMQSYKRTLGVDIKAKFQEWGIFLDACERGDYQFAYITWGPYYDDPYDLLSGYVSTTDVNFSFWKNDKYDTLIKEAGREMDEAKRADLLVQAERILVKDDMAVIPVGTSSGTVFYNKCIRNIAVLPFSCEGNKYLYTEGR